mgnify:CR=1 FL=1
MINSNIEKHITEKVSQIQSLMTDKIWLQDNIKEINEFNDVCCSESIILMNYSNYF